MLALGWSSPQKGLEVLPPPIPTSFPELALVWVPSSIQPSCPLSLFHPISQPALWGPWDLCPGPPLWGEPRQAHQTPSAASRAVGQRRVITVLLLIGHLGMAGTVPKREWRMALAQLAYYRQSLWATIKPRRRGSPCVCYLHPKDQCLNECKLGTCTGWGVVKKAEKKAHS